VIFAKLEQRRLHALRKPPRFDLLAALLAKFPPAVSVAVDERLDHRDTSGGIRRHGGGRLGSGLLEAVQKLGCALRMRCRIENRALIVLQHLDPRADIGGMILADFRREVEVG
jgi:hypothetical protein